MHSMFTSFLLLLNSPIMRWTTIAVGDREFEVVTARSQFKYAGGKKFVMCRKILEVKEITRIAEEASLTRSMSKSGDLPSAPSLE